MYVQEAAKALREMDNHRLDKLHLVRCYRVDDLDRLRNVPEEYTQPDKSTFDEEVRHITESLFTQSATECLVICLEIERLKVGGTIFR